ncbi:uncharacterized protein ARMOST_13807 [Armillaria ostoyae]|uniref:Uncharacterized protein n=1 Tax=Armillaria ostoyae TaxID=47428 RepID=A0A284RNV5_ARMOS|nr:uncharacterized protein ARMOST_13807 [Armillaria ostoyae]
MSCIKSSQKVLAYPVAPIAPDSDHFTHPTRNLSREATLTADPFDDA